MKQEIIQVPGLKAIGPFSQAVKAAGLLFVSGQPGVNPDTGDAAGDTFEVQAQQVFRNLEMVLKAAAAGWTSSLAPLYWWRMFRASPN